MTDDRRILCDYDGTSRVAALRRLLALHEQATTTGPFMRWCHRLVALWRAWWAR